MARFRSLEVPASINDIISARQIALPRCNSCDAVASRAVRAFRRARAAVAEAVALHRIRNARPSIEVQAPDQSQIDRGAG
jgi:hypothetical protein